MEAEYRNKIYDRLLSIKLDIEMQSFPNPQYINEKIGQCHAFIDEVERFSIETSKDISIQQQALNNAEADYEVKLEDLLINNGEIKSLPSIRDREAKANSLLKDELRDIHRYENVLTELNNLLKAINLKNRNLGRTNTDIRLMVRIMESQIKLGVAPETDTVVKSLLDEMDKAESDSFEDAEAEVIEESVVDPTEDLNIDEILNTKPEASPEKEPVKTEEPVNAESLPEKFNVDEFFETSSEPDPELQASDTKPEEKSEKVPEKKEPTVEESEESLVKKGLIDPAPNFDKTAKDPVITEDLPVIEDDEEWPFNLDDILDEDDKKPAEVKSEQKTVDLDSNIDFKDQKEGGGEQKDDKTKSKKKTVDNQKNDRQTKSEKIGIDMDDFLDSITT